MNGGDFVTEQLHQLEGGLDCRLQKDHIEYQEESSNLLSKPQRKLPDCARTRLYDELCCSESDHDSASDCSEQPGDQDGDILTFDNAQDYTAVHNVPFKNVGQTYLAQEVAQATDKR